MGRGRRCNGFRRALAEAPTSARWVGQRFANSSQVRPDPPDGMKFWGAWRREGNRHAAPSRLEPVSNLAALAHANAVADHERRLADLFHQGAQELDNLAAS